MSKQGGRIQSYQRIQRIYDLIGDGYLTFQIVKICGDEWGIGRRAVEKYLTKVYAFLREGSLKSREDVIVEYNKLIRKHEEENPELALKYRMHRDKILGLMVDRVEHSGEVNIKAKFNKDGEETE